MFRIILLCIFVSSSPILAGKESGKPPSSWVARGFSALSGAIHLLSRNSNSRDSQFARYIERFTRLRSGFTGTPEQIRQFEELQTSYYQFNPPRKGPVDDDDDINEEAENRISELIDQIRSELPRERLGREIFNLHRELRTIDSDPLMVTEEQVRGYEERVRQIDARSVEGFARETRQQFREIQSLLSDFRRWQRIRSSFIAGTGLPGFSYVFSPSSPALNFVVGMIQRVDVPLESLMFEDRRKLYRRIFNNLIVLQNDPRIIRDPELLAAIDRRINELRILLINNVKSALRSLREHQDESSVSNAESALHEAEVFSGSDLLSELINELRTKLESAKVALKRNELHSQEAQARLRLETEHSEELERLSRNFKRERFHREQTEQEQRERASREQHRHEEQRGNSHNHHYHYQTAMRPEERGVREALVRIIQAESPETQISLEADLHGFKKAVRPLLLKSHPDKTVSLDPKERDRREQLTKRLNSLMDDLGKLIDKRNGK